ncbi:hypothetical protein AALB39_27425 [Lachnospiraceae bacterium 54-53]
MTVKEVKKQIEILENKYKNMIKLQEYFLGSGTSSQETIDKVKVELEENADLSIPIRDLCSSVAAILRTDIERLENLIDNTVVKVN